MQSDNRFLAREACRAVADQIFAMTTGGGKTWVLINSRWGGGTRWMRNLIHTSGEMQQSEVTISRIIRGTHGLVQTNVLDDVSLRTLVRQAETIMTFQGEGWDDYPDTPRTPPPPFEPALWFDETSHLDEAARANIAEHAITLAVADKCVAAGYLQVGALGQAVINADGLFRYYPYTTAQYSVTVRDPDHQASGWAGMDHNDWRQIDPHALTQRALEKCQRSRNPVAIEPGRYTVILEPQAVCDLVAPLVELAMGRAIAEMGGGPFADPNRPGSSRIGQTVLDTRLTLSVDPMDPNCGFVPFNGDGEPYPRVNWIEHGVLKELSYELGYGIQQLGKDRGLFNSGAFRLQGDLDRGSMTMEDMIAHTQRGLLVTRFNNIRVLDSNTMLLTGNTRDGLWLIERGKITKAVKNLRFTESPLFVLNSVEAFDRPTRVFRPDAPALVPPVMARDFSFTGLMDAV